MVAIRESISMGDLDLRLFLSTSIPGAHMVQLEILGTSPFAEALQKPPGESLRASGPAR